MGCFDGTRRQRGHRRDPVCGSCSNEQSGSPHRPDHRLRLFPRKADGSEYLARVVQPITRLPHGRRPCAPCDPCHAHGLRPRDAGCREHRSGYGVRIGLYRVVQQPLPALHRLLRLHRRFTGGQHGADEKLHQRHPCYPRDAHRLQNDLTA